MTSHPVRGVSFDGTSDYLHTDVMSAAEDVSRLVLSFWFKQDGTKTGIRQDLIDCAGARVSALITTGNLLSIRARNSGATIFLQHDGADYTGDTDPHHIFMYLDGTATGGSFCLADGVATGAMTTNNVADVINAGVAEWAIGSRVTGGTPFAGSLGHVFVGDPGRVVTSADAAMFVDSANKPRFPGRNPFGGPDPIIALHGGVDDAGKNWGIGGDFAVNGAPGAAGTDFAYT